MNEFEEALEILSSDTVLEEKFNEKYPDDFLSIHASIHFKMQYKRKLNILVNRATPKKPIEDLKSPIRYVKTYECPNCHNKFTGSVSIFCYHCGQAIDWSEADET